MTDALSAVDAFTEMVGGRGQVEPDEAVLEDGVAFAGVAKYPARVKCALLSWMAFKDATRPGASQRKEGQHERGHACRQRGTWRRSPTSRRP